MTDNRVPTTEQVADAYAGTDWDHNLRRGDFYDWLYRELANAKEEVDWNYEPYPFG